MKITVPRFFPFDQNAIDVAGRFPLPTLCSFLLCIVTLLSSHKVGWIRGHTEEQFIRILICSYFWCGAAVLIAESRRWPLALHMLLVVPGEIALCLLLLTGSDYMQTTRFAMLVPALLLGLMAAPFLQAQRGDNAAFWMFNYRLCNGVFIAFTASFIACLGLWACLESIQYLFKTDWKNNGFFDVWIICATLIAPLYALFWVPRTFDENLIAPAKPYVILANWILAPLSLLYFVILYAYYAKIGLDWQLPNGNLAAITAGFGGFGMAFYIAAWPLCETGGGVLRFMHRRFFALLILPLGMMALAIGVRVGDYGVTEERYGVMLILLWMALAAIGFAVKRLAVPLKILPMLLASLILAVTFGPWGVFAVSLQSQSHRLDKFFHRHAMIEKDRVIESPKKVSLEDQVDLSSILDYFWHTDKESYLPYQLDLSGGREDAMKSLGLAYLSRESLKYMLDNDLPFSLNIYAPSSYIAVNVTGYDFLLPMEGNISFSSRPSDDNPIIISADPATGSPEIVLAWTSPILTVKAAGQQTSFDLSGLAAQKAGQAALTEDRLTFSPQESVMKRESGVLHTLLLLRSLSGHRGKGGLRIDDVSFKLAVKVTSP